VLAHVAWLYQHRGDEAAEGIPAAALALYRPYRVAQI
jgi:hypothetical protein